MIYRYGWIVPKLDDDEPDPVEMVFICCGNAVYCYQIERLKNIPIKKSEKGRNEVEKP